MINIIKLVFCVFLMTGCSVQKVDDRQYAQQSIVDLMIKHRIVRIEAAENDNGFIIDTWHTTE